MVEMFVERMCFYCKNKNCNKKIKIEKNGDYTTYKCEEYIKDTKKIIPYQKPLVVTAKRDYVNNKEV